MSDRSHYFQIAGLLLAGDIQTRVLSNGEVHLIEVQNREHGQRIVWGNSNGGHWGWTMISSKTGESMSQMTAMLADADAHEVARTIATAFEITELPEED